MQLGRAAKVTVDKDNTTIVDGAGNAKAIKDRVAEIKTQIDAATSEAGVADALAQAWFTQVQEPQA